MPDVFVWKTALTAGTEAVSTAVPAAKSATVNIVLCNETASPANVRVRIGTGVSSVLADGYYPSALLPVGGTVHLSGVALLTGEKVFVLSDVTNVAVSVRGWTEGDA
jgi:hypothetical protein